MEHYDSVLIGTGQATGSLISGLVERGEKLAVIERDRVGGTCVNFGCTPTKTIVASARAAHMVRRAGEFGIKVDGFSIDFARVMERQNSLREGSSNGLRNYLKEVSDFYEGHGRIVSPTEVAVGDSVISANRIYIHTGARARKPEIPGIESVPYMSNRELLELDHLPEHLIVIGGSYIGLEFSQAFLRFGSSVTVVERGPAVMPREDEDISRAAQDILVEEGIQILCGSRVDSVQPEGNGVSVTLTRNDTTTTVSGSHLLVATGRVPNTEDLGLTEVGIETNDRGYIVVDDHLQTNVPGIYALGDVNGRGAFTHTAVHDGQIILKNLTGEEWKISDRIVIYSMFMDPPLARVGMNTDQALASGRSVLQGTMPMSRISRAREKDETSGMVKILVDADDKTILGAAILGVGGDEIINGIAAWMYTGLPYTDLQKAVLAHPTVSELMPWVLNDLKPVR